MMWRTITGTAKGCFSNKKMVNFIYMANKYMCTVLLFQYQRDSVDITQVMIPIVNPHQMTMMMIRRLIIKSHRTAALIMAQMLKMRTIKLKRKMLKRMAKGTSKVKS